MDLKAKHLIDTCSDPIELLRQLRQTTEPIGGSTVYDEDGEFVEYDVAIEAVKKANDAFIEKAVNYIAENLRKDTVERSQTKAKFIHNFKNYMKGL